MRLSLHLYFGVPKLYFGVPKLNFGVPQIHRQKREPAKCGALWASCLPSSFLFCLVFSFPSSLLSLSSLLFPLLLLKRMGLFGKIGTTSRVTKLKITEGKKQKDK